MENVQEKVICTQTLLMLDIKLNETGTEWYM